MSGDSEGSTGSQGDARDLPSPPSDKPDEATRAGELEFQYDEQVIRHAKAAAEAVEWENEARRLYSRLTFGTSVAWLLVVAFIVLLSGCKSSNFEVDPKVLIVLIGTTTINVIAWFAAVTRYLFAREHRTKMMELPALRTKTKKQPAKRAKKPSDGDTR